MKEVIVLIQKGGVVKIFAEGIKGQGTADFTEELANDLGKIEERHKGPAGHVHHDHWRKTIDDHLHGHSHG